MCVCVCVRPGIQSEDQNQFFTFKVRTFWQSEVKISVLALWLCALSSLFHNMGVGGHGRNPLFVRARHVQRCEKMSSLWMCYTQICPRFECRDEHTIHTCIYCVLTLNAETGRGVCVCVFDARKGVSFANKPNRIIIIKNMFIGVFIWLFIEKKKKKPIQKHVVLLSANCSSVNILHTEVLWHS